MDEMTCSGAVLIVDDEPLVVKYIASVARMEGFSVIHRAGSLRAAEELIASHPIQVIICDFCLPDGNGTRAATAVLQENPLAKVVLTSGHALDDLEIPPALKERIEFLEKPFSAEQLVAIFNEVKSSVVGLGSPNAALLAHSY